ncbi:hypothetical protein PV11_03504 [Exophiala sideris]|uniref:Uncharacterized protein n=1 Tax=Exophiala sideris TaxID=1016849 RepID=A0A0D1YED1_9EURO|nr:hypothetical protein PV11_03504 [Exophiala sideris]
MDMESVPDDRTALLNGNRAERDSDGPANTSCDRVSTNATEPPEKEHSTTKLAFIMGSVWIGVFFAALGKDLVLSPRGVAER